MGKLNYHSYVNCPGYFEVGGGKKWKCENHPRGALNYFEAFSKSCNTYFGSLANNVGRQGMTDAAVATGFGQKSGLDTTGEVAGVVPTLDWWAKNKPKDVFRRGHLVNMGIGQGELGVTPLQMCELTSIVANEGIGYRPHFVKASIDAEGRTTPVAPEPIYRVDLPSDFWQHLKQAMVGVNERGTARSSGPIAGVTWGGKTGSAEHRRGQKTHAWYIGIAPMKSPQLTITVMIEKSGHGGDIAAPIAAKLVRYWLKDAKAASTAANASVPSEPERTEE
jgi:penicillin-binding protein 2